MTATCSTLSLHAICYACTLCQLVVTDTLAYQQFQDSILCCWRPHPVNGDRACHHHLSIHTWPGRAMWEEHVDIISSLLPGSWLEGGAWRDNFCMVVAAGFNLSPFGTRELRAQVVHIDSAASSHIHTTSELWYLLRWDSCGCTSHDSPTWLDVSR